MVVGTLPTVRAAAVAVVIKIKIVNVLKNARSTNAYYFLL